MDGDFIPSFDGASNRFQYLSRHLQKSGVEVVVFHGYRRWSDIHLIREEPFKTYCISKDSYYNDLDFICSLVNKEGIDLIQFDNLEPILIQGAKIAAKTQTHLVSEMHYCVSDLAKSLGAKSERIDQIKEMEKLTGRFVDHLICLNVEDAEKLTKSMGLDTSRISTIPSGVDLEEIKYRDRTNGKHIIFLGNLFFEPNAEATRKIRRLIYPQLSKIGYKFLIIGDCPADLSKELGDANFIFLGTIPDLNLAFRDALVALAPIDEGTGIRVKILNYMAAGIPVIATSQAISGLREVKNIIIEDNIHLYPRLIIQLTDDAKNTASMGSSLRAQAERSYGWDTIASQTKETYKQILKAPTTSKKQLLSLLDAIDTREPVWLEEATEKHRFYPKYPEMDGDCVLVDKGIITTIR